MLPTTHYWNYVSNINLLQIIDLMFGKKWNRWGIKPRSKGIWSPFDCHSGGRMHPRRN